MRMEGLLLALIVARLAYAATAGCDCDPKDPKSLEARECNLTREALAQPASSPFFFLRDINPRKPNRWLALPVAAHKNQRSLADMTPQARLGLWSAAIRKAKELWGDSWGLAYNGDQVRTQCHPHVHIGKLLDEVETPRFLLVDGPADIPAPANGEGLWVHPQDNRLHVHFGEQLTETVLLR